MKHSFLIVIAVLLVSCRDSTTSVDNDKETPGIQWSDYSMHEKIFDCMYFRDDEYFPDEIDLSEDYALIIYGHWEEADEVPKIAAVLASKENKRIEKVVGLGAIETLFSTIKIGRTIRRYEKCLVPLVYDVPRAEIDSAEQLIPEGMHWVADDESLICTCPKN